jgi:hypothetical protein
MQKFVSVAAALVLFACSGSGHDGGTAPDGGAPDAAASDATSQDAVALSDAGAAGPCAFGLGGSRSVPQTNGENGGCQGYIAAGTADYVLQLGASIKSGGGTVSVSCRLSSPTPPAAGVKFTLTTGTGGICQVDEIVGTTDTVWVSSTTSMDGAATVTIVSATLKPSIYTPGRSFYVYEATLDARLQGRTAGATELTVTGNVKYTTLPPGV